MNPAQRYSMLPFSLGSGSLNPIVPIQQGISGLIGQPDGSPNSQIGGKLRYAAQQDALEMGKIAAGGL